MPDPALERTTRLLKRVAQGDPAAADELLPLLHDELQRLARHHMQAQRPDHTLEPTALVNEAWLKLVDQSDADWTSRKHFLCVASRAMRSVLVDHARARGAEKRRAGPRIPLEQAEMAWEDRLADALSVSELLERLKAFDAELAEIVELRFFGGLTNAEAAQVRGVSERTVERGWRVARAWLYREIAEAEPDGS